MNTTKNLSTITKSQLAQQYGVSLPTLRKWISKIVDTNKRQIIYPSELKKIYEVLGCP